MRSPELESLLVSSVREDYLTGPISPFEAKEEPRQKGAMRSSLIKRQVRNVVIEERGEECHSCREEVNSMRELIRMLTLRVQEV